MGFEMPPLPSPKGETRAEYKNVFAFLRGGPPFRESVGQRSLNRAATGMNKPSGNGF